MFFSHSQFSVSRNQFAGNEAQVKRKFRAEIFLHINLSKTAWNYVIWKFAGA
jgi:hypothetical protein